MPKGASRDASTSLDMRVICKERSVHNFEEIGVPSHPWIHSSIKVSLTRRQYTLLEDLTERKAKDRDK
ncbi:hypothetical protein E2C01_039097 [Portunus trituberculatus]|uniref:Uncharacterized protein n=1 Tax=Portunus trituberculatus TaxID=210409 RepID=A0A5B7FJR2_PORTR|nr:hypothetical protein [Portunus trituberculatus]